jgi:DNA-directed RNA polymerase subunit RPC12/RpoP
MDNQIIECPKCGSKNISHGAIWANGSEFRTGAMELECQECGRKLFADVEASENEADDAGYKWHFTSSTR